MSKGANMKIVIIGGGPGGYVAALSAVQMGANVCLIEKEHFGGTCVNRGCIPTKALLKAIYPLVEAKRYQSMGIDMSSVSFNLDKIRSHSQKSAQLSRQGIEYLLKKREVKLIKGEVIDGNSQEVLVKLNSGEEFFESYDQLIIATGSYPAQIPGLPFDRDKIISSDEALLIRKIPENMLIIGGGVIGIEMATIYQNLGSKVTIVEMMPQLLPGEDPETVQILSQILMKNGIQLWMGQKIEKVETGVETCTVCLNKDNTLTQEEFEQILLAVGRKPQYPLKLIESLGIKLSPSGIEVNGFMQTNIENVYAIGDVNGSSLLAHTAFKEAKIACEHIMGKPCSPMDYSLVPRVVYSIPEFAAIGDSAGSTAYTFPYAANGRARAGNIREGMIKLFVSEGCIKACSIIGENASDIIGLANMAISKKIPLSQMEEIILAHPTYSEVFTDVIEVALGKPIHLA